MSLKFQIVRGAFALTVLAALNALALVHPAPAARTGHDVAIAARAPDAAYSTPVVDQAVGPVAVCTRDDDTTVSVLIL